MRVFGREITVNKAPVAPRVVEGAKNDYADSVAGRLAARYGASTVQANGRSINSGYDQEAIQEIYQGYIFGAIKKIRNQVADILVNNIEVFDPTKGSSPKDSPALDGVKHPYQKAIENATSDDTLFYAGIATYILVLGEAFIDAGLRTMQAGNIKPTDQFELLQSNQIVRTYDDKGNLVSYKWKRKLPNGTTDETLYVPTNVIALIDLNPWDLRKGYGQIRPIVDKIALENMATKLQIANLANGIKAPGILSSKEKLGEDDYEDLKNSVTQRWTSNDMDKQGTPIVTNGGFVDYKSLLEDLDKLAMEKIRDMNRDAFFAALSVSKTILGIEESGTTRETSRVQREQFILDACMPLANSIVNGLNQDYINMYPVDYRKKPLKMRAVAPIEKDLEQEKAEADIAKIRAEAYKTYIEAGMAPEQAAKKAGIEMEDGETIQVVEKPAPTNTIVLTTEQLQAITGGRNDAGSAAPVHIHNHNDSHVHRHDPADLAQAAKNKLSDKEQERITDAEANLRADVAELDEKLGNKYADTLDTNALDTQEEQAYIAALTNALMVYYSVAVPIFGRNRLRIDAADFDKEISDFVFNEQVREIVRQRLAKVANAHFAEIDEQLTKLIADGTRDGAARADIIRSVKEKVANEVKTWQVERLVQTETTNAFNQATYLADKQFITANGYVGKAYKVWQTNSPRPCPFCTANAGREVEFETDFYKVGEVAEGVKTMADGKEQAVYYPVRFVDVNAGGLHPNCHCDYRLVIR